MSEALIVLALLDEYREIVSGGEDWPPQQVVEDGFRLWAIKEMMDIIQGAPFYDCEWLLEHFYIQMAQMAQATSLRGTDYNLFAIAADEAESILTMLQIPQDE
jgi:hypothetical protein